MLQIQNILLNMKTNVMLLISLISYERINTQKIPPHMAEMY